jgi:hypothetical protein
LNKSGAAKGCGAHRVRHSRGVRRVKRGHQERLHETKIKEPEQACNVKKWDAEAGLLRWKEK